MIPVSWLSRWLYCPRQVFLEAVRGIKPKEDARMTEGSIAHKILSRVYSRHHALLSTTTPKMGKPGFQKLFRDSYLEMARDSIIARAPKLKRCGVSLVELYDKYSGIISQLATRHATEAFAFATTFSLFGEALVENLYPKYEVSVFLDSVQLQLKGEVDIVEIYLGEQLPVELKTSKPPARGVWGTDQLQLAAYIMLLQYNGREKLSKGVVEYLGHGRRVPIVLNPFLVDEVTRVRDEILHMLETRQEPELPETKDRCKHCSFDNKCWSRG